MSLYPPLFHQPFLSIFLPQFMSLKPPLFQYPSLSKILPQFTSLSSSISLHISHLHSSIHLPQFLNHPSLSIVLHQSTSYHPLSYPSSAVHSVLHTSSRPLLSIFHLSLHLLRLVFFVDAILSLSHPYPLQQCLHRKSIWQQAKLAIHTKQILSSAHHRFSIKIGEHFVDFKLKCHDYK